MFKPDVKLRLLEVSEVEDLARFLREVASKGPMMSKRCGQCGEMTVYGHSQMQDEAMERALKLQRLIDGEKDG